MGRNWPGQRFACIIRASVTSIYYLGFLDSKASPDMLQDLLLICLAYWLRGGELSGLDGSHYILGPSVSCKEARHIPYVNNA